MSKYLSKHVPDISNMSPGHFGKQTISGNNHLLGKIMLERYISGKYTIYHIFMYGTSGVIEMPPAPASPAIQSSRSWARGPPEEPGPWSKLLGAGIRVYGIRYMVYGYTVYGYTVYDIRVYGYTVICPFLQKMKVLPSLVGKILIRSARPFCPH